MKHTAGIAIIAATLGLVATIQLAPALAGHSATQETREIESAPTRRYVMADGKAIRGKVVATDGARVQIRVSVAGGSGTAWYTIEGFEDKSQVDLRRIILAPEDVSGALAVAEFAMEKGLLEESRKQLRRTALLAEDESLEAGPDFRPRAVALIENVVAGLVASGKVREAQNGVSRMLTRHGSDLTDSEREGLMNALDSAVSVREETAQQERRDKLDDKAAAALEKKIAPIEKAIDEGASIRREALLGSRTRGNTRSQVARSVSKYEKALKDLDKLMAESMDDRGLMAELAALGQKATAGMYDSLLTGASLDLTRGQFNKALEAVNRVLADDSENKEALAMRARIEVAANDWGWWR